MASANYQTKLTADTSQHDQALSRSAKQVYDYKKSCDSTDKGVGKLLGTFKKFAGALGGIKIAGDLFKKMMVENQEMADRYGATMEMAKTITSEFAYSLSSFDFSNMYDGLGDLISRAKEYYDAMDALETFHIASTGINAHDQKLLSDAYLAIREGRFEEGLKLLNEAEAAASDTAMHNYKKATEALDKFVAKIAYAKESVRKGGDVWGAVAGNQKWTVEASLSTGRVRDLIYDAAKGGHMLDTEISKAKNHLREAEKAAEGYNEAHQRWYDVAKAKSELEVLNRIKSQLTDGDNLKMFSQLDAEIVNSERGLSDLQRTILRYRNMAEKGLNGDNNPTSGSTVKAKTELEPPPAGSIAELEKVLADLKEKYRLATTDEGENGRNSLKKQIEEAEDELKRLKGEMNNLPAGSLAQWKEDLKTLQLQWELATTDEDRAKIKEAIDTVQAEIDRINGVVIPATVEPEKGSIAYLQKKIAEKKQEMERSGDLEFIIKCKLDIEGLEADIKKLTDATKTPAEIAQDNIDALKQSYEDLSDVSNSCFGVMGSAMDTWAQIEQATFEANEEHMSKAEKAEHKRTMAYIRGTQQIIDAVGKSIPAILSLMAAQEGEAMAAGVAGAAKVEPLPAKIAAIATIVAQLLAVFGTIASISAASKYADGGIIGGNSRIGDMNIARVNAGEMILNGRQQANLFRLLNGNMNFGSNNEISGNVRFEIEGTKLVGVLGNYNRKISRVKP